MCLAPTQSALLWTLSWGFPACMFWLYLFVFFLLSFLLFSPSLIDHTEVSTHRWWRWPAGQWWVEWQVVTRQIKHRSLLRCSGQQWSSERLPKKKTKNKRQNINCCGWNAGCDMRKSLKAASPISPLVLSSFSEPKAIAGSRMAM